jgi:hypothetical protein
MPRSAIYIGACWRKWKCILNNVALDGMGMALRHPVIVLSYAVISLAAAMGGPGSSSSGSLAAVNNNYAPRKAGNDVWGDTREKQRHGFGGKYNNQLKRQ